MPRSGWSVFNALNALLNLFFGVSNFRQDHWWLVAINGLAICVAISAIVVAERGANNVERLRADALAARVQMQQLLAEQRAGGAGGGFLNAYTFRDAAFTKDAEKRAEELLISKLNVQQRADWKAHRYFTVKSQKGNQFKIDTEYSGNCTELKSGNRYCIVPLANIPTGDRLLAQKIMLETDEQKFMTIAHSLGRRRRDIYY